MTMDNLLKAIQIADDLDEQATRQNIFISDPSIKKSDRKSAVEKQLALRQQAAELRVNAIQEIIGNAVPTIEEIVDAADKAKTAANKINDIKKCLDLAAATITFFAAFASRKIAAIVPAYAAFKSAIK